MNFSLRTAPRPHSMRRLLTEYTQLTKDPDCKWFKITPMEGFVPGTESPDGYLCKWQIDIYGFQNTIYEGYTLKAEMLFPKDYPLSPPKMFFLTKMYHPNIYEDGKVCISILHTAHTDPHTDELDTEQWTPVLCVRTILLSIMLLLNEPNTNSPANIDASIHFRKSRPDYEEYVKTKILNVYAQKADTDSLYL